MSSSSADRVIREGDAPRDEMANTLRALAMDAVQQANSGHPGAPMGMAEMAVALWGSHLRHNPAHPKWADRDRFVLSNGHASMLLYSLLHLTGYDLAIDELKRFRQLHSKTPGHPEVGLTPGVETTTGPLGQGLTNAVGFALAERLLADEFNQSGHEIVNHHSYVFLGDGCLMEGISHEACALAGAWKLNKLIALYDDNGISIDGAVKGWFIDDTAMRFRAYGWTVIGPIDGHSVADVSHAIAQAKTSADKPTLTSAARPSAKARRREKARPRRMASRSAPTRLRPRARRSAGRTLRSRFHRRSQRDGTRVRLARRARPSGTHALSPTAAHTRSSRRSTSAAWPASCRMTSTRRCSLRCPSSAHRKRPSPRARPRRKCWRCWHPKSPSCSAAALT
jgi:transketolase N-terminal domain/subunit